MSRTQFTCVKCGYCYSCHWKNEELEKVKSERNDSAVIPQPAMIAIEQSSAGQKAMDVYGQQTEPICNYRTCNHKFSEHGHKCKCHHAMNYATGMSISPLR